MLIDIYLGKSSCWVSDRYCTIPNVYLLEGLYTRESGRGVGAAKRLLRVVKKWAKRKGVGILLYIGSFADKPMDDGQLFRFYSKMGFIPYKPEDDTRTQYMCFNLSG